MRFAKQFINCSRLGPQPEQKVRDTIFAKSPGNNCAQCHLRQSHKKHPEYDKG